MITFNKSNTKSNKTNTKSNKSDIKSNTKTIVFVDRALDNYEQIVEGAISGAEVVLIDQNRDGIE